MQLNWRRAVLERTDNTSARRSVNRISVLILLLYAPGSSTEANEAVSGRTRLQKQTFLVQQQLKSLGVKSMYSFRPYKLGPLSYEIYNDLEWLKLEGVVKEISSTLPDGTRFSKFTLTDKGMKEAERLLTVQEWPPIYSLVRQVKKATNALDLSFLVESVHEAYPEYVLRTPVGVLLESFAALPEDQAESTSSIGVDRRTGRGRSDKRAPNSQALG